MYRKLTYLTLHRLLLGALITFGSIHLCILFPTNGIGASPTVFGPSDHNSAMVRVAKNHYFSYGLEFSRVISMQFDINAGVFYSTVEYFDSPNNCFRLFFFYLEHSQEFGWRGGPIREFSNLSNFSSPVISPRMVFSAIVLELLKDTVANLIVSAGVGLQHTLLPTTAPKDYKAHE